MGSFLADSAPRVEEKIKMGSCCESTVCIFKSKIFTCLLFTYIYFFHQTSHLNFDFLFLHDIKGYNFYLLQLLQCEEWVLSIRAVGQECWNRDNNTFYLLNHITFLVQTLSKCMWKLLILQLYFINMFNKQSQKLKLQYLQWLENFSNINST